MTRITRDQDEPSRQRMGSDEVIQTMALEWHLPISFARLDVERQDGNNTEQGFDIRPLPFVIFRHFPHDLGKGNCRSNDLAGVAPLHLSAGFRRRTLKEVYENVAVKQIDGLTHREAASRPNRDPEVRSPVPRRSVA